jgi:hypothetical protein
MATTQQGDGVVRKQDQEGAGPSSARLPLGGRQGPGRLNIGNQLDPSSRVPGD